MICLLSSPCPRAGVVTAEPWAPCPSNPLPTASDPERRQYTKIGSQSGLWACTKARNKTKSKIKCTETT